MKILFFQKYGVFSHQKLPDHPKENPKNFCLPNILAPVTQENSFFFVTFEQLPMSKKVQESTPPPQGHLSKRAFAKV